MVMKIDQLKYLRAVCAAGSISKVADDLFMSRSAVSKSLRELEAETGVSLFVRTNAGIALTNDGCVFYEKGMEILKLIDELEAIMSELREKNKAAGRGTVRVGLTPGAGATVFPTLYEYFQNECPDVSLNLMEYSWAQSELMLQDGTMDFNLTSDVDTLPETLDSMELFDTELCFCVSKNHPLAKKKAVTPDDIKNEPLILMDTNFYRESFLDELYVKYGNVPRIKFRSRQIAMIKRMTAGGVCCAIQMRGVIDDGESIIALPFEPEFNSPIYLTWRKEALRNGACEIFLETAKSFRKEMRGK